MSGAAKKRKGYRPSPRTDTLGDDALIFFLLALGLGKNDEQAIRGHAARQGAVRGVYAEAQIAADVIESADASRAEGESLEAFKARAVDALRSSWGAEGAFRVDLMAGMAAQGAYERGRWTETMTPARAPAGGSSRLLTYSSALEPRTCAFCRGLHGTTRPADDSWWMTYYPPVHGSCACFVSETGPGGAATGDPPLPDPKADGFGGAPTEWTPPYDEMPGEIAAAARAKG